MAFDQRLADVPHHLATRRLRLRIEIELREHLPDDFDVVLGLLEILLPLFLEVFVQDAAQAVS